MFCNFVGRTEFYKMTLSIWTHALTRFYDGMCSVGYFVKKRENVPISGQIRPPLFNVFLYLSKTAKYNALQYCSPYMRVQNYSTSCFCCLKFELPIYQNTQKFKISGFLWPNVKMAKCDCRF